MQTRGDCTAADSVAFVGESMGSGRRMQALTLLEARRGPTSDTACS